VKDHPFKFNIDATIEAVCIITNEYTPGHRNDIFGVLHILALAEREVLISRGNMITGDYIDVVERGMVLRNTMNLIHGLDTISGGSLSRWREFFKTNTITIETIKHKDMYELCDNDFHTIRKICARHSYDDCFDLSLITKALPEWHDPRQSRSILTPREIMIAEGLPIAQINDMLEEADTQLRITKFLTEAEKESGVESGLAEGAD